MEIVDTRDRLPIGAEVPWQENIVLTISRFVGCGSNSIVYLAEYPDSLHKDKFHTVLIKELFPLHSGNLIWREGQSIVYAKEAARFFELHKESFEKGNAANLSMLSLQEDMVCPNIDSFKANGTYYTILGYSRGETLQQVMPSKNLNNSLSDVTAYIINILDALEAFHNNKILHLDISPDNILLSPLKEGKSELYRKVILIDYNSVWNMGESPEFGNTYVGIKENYSAMEVRHQDYDSLCPATDLFSVCSIFYEYLKGQPLNYFDLSKPQHNLYNNLPLLNGVPASAASKVLQILKRGLMLPHKLRYQSVSEMRANFLELLNRIEKVGITHSALWEISAENFQNFCRRNKHEPNKKLEMEVSLNNGPPDTIFAILGNLSKEYNPHGLITATGGMGKTTLLLQLWENGLSKYNENLPVPFYLPLYQWRETDGDLFIKHALLEKLCNDKPIINAKDEMNALNKLLEKPCSVLLLLDGLNEVSGDSSPLLAEIRALMKKRGVQVILTSRTDSITIEGMNALNILPIKEAIVREYLQENDLAFPEEKALIDLIANTLMLTLYVKTCKLRDDNVNIASSDILFSEYLNSLFEKNGAGLDIWQVDYGMFFVLPVIAEKMAEIGKYSISLLELDSLIETLYDSLNDDRYKDFSKTFPHFIGRSIDIKGKAKNKDEWFNIIIYSILEGQLGLLKKDDKNNYLLAHQNFRDYLSAKNKEILAKLANWAKLNKKTRKKKYAIIAAILSCFALIQIFFTDHFPLFRNDYPVWANDIKNVNYAMNALGERMGKLDIQIYTELELLKTAQKDPGAFYSMSLKNQNDLDAIHVDTKVNNDVISVLSSPNGRIPLDIMEPLLKEPIEHKKFFPKMVSNLNYALSDKSVYPDHVKEEIIKSYISYLDCYANINYIKLKLVLLPLNEPGRKKMMMEFLPRMRVFGEKLKENTLDTEEKLKGALIRETGNLNEQRGNLVKLKVWSD